MSIGDAEEAKEESKQVMQQVRLAVEEDSPELEAAFDDVSGAQLDPEMVYRARLEEVE